MLHDSHYICDNAGQTRTQAAPPLSPDPPKATSVSSSSIKLSWHAPDSQGAPVTEYAVSIQASTVFAHGHLVNGHHLGNGHAGPQTQENGNQIKAYLSDSHMPNNLERRVVLVKGAQLSTTVTGWTATALLNA